MILGLLRKLAWRPLRRLAASVLFTAWPMLAAAAPSLFVEAAVEPNPVDVGAQAVYTLRFFQAVDFRNLRFHQPHARLAEIRPLDADAGPPRYAERMIEGQRYRVFERRYAVLPFASGALAIGGASAAGRNASGQAIDLPAPELTLEVASAPPAQNWPAGAHWLPARRVVLHEDQAPPSVFKLGDVLARTLHIEAEGVNAAALPALTPEAPGWRVHADAPVLANRVVGDAIVGTRSQRFHWLATGSGTFALPPIGLDWWDVGTRTWGRAELPARPVSVVGVTTGVDHAAAAPGMRAAQVATAVLGFVFFAALVAGARLSLRSTAWRRRQTRHRLLAACRRNDPSAAREALLAWARLASPGIELRTTGGVAHLHPPLVPAIAKLDAALYGPNAGRWNGEELAAVLRA